MKNIKSLVTVALAVVIIGSCKKEETTPTTTQTPTPNTASKICRVKTMKEGIKNSPPSTGANDTIPFSPFISSSYEYDSDGKISKISYDSSGVLLSYILYNYSTNGIIDEKYFSATGTQQGHIIYKLGSNGYASISIDGDNPQDTLSIYEYDADGYLIKITDKWGDVAVTNNTITNGNLTQSITAASGKTMTTTYEYTNKSDKISVGKYLYSSGSFVKKYFLGKSHTNFPSTVTMSGTLLGGNTTTASITYTLDSNGYPSEIIYINKSGSMSQIMKYEFTYNCQ